MIDPEFYGPIIVKTFDLKEMFKEGRLEEGLDEIESVLRQLKERKDQMLNRGTYSYGPAMDVALWGQKALRLQTGTEIHDFLDSIHGLWSVVYHRSQDAERLFESNADEGARIAAKAEGEALEIIIEILGSLSITLSSTVGRI